MKTDKLSWTTTTIAEIASVKTGPFGSALHESDYVLAGTPIVTVEHLSESGIQHTNLPLVSDEDVNRLSSYICRPGDILFSRVGSIDRNSLVSTKEDGWLFSGRLLRVRTDSRLVHAPFLSYLFSTSEFKNLVRTVAVGQTMPSLNTKLLGGLRVSFPGIAEQHEIADKLGDADTLISELEQLIAKKRLTKQGMMQQLLTGKTRLPGYTGQWRESKYLDVLTLRKGTALAATQSSGDIPVIAAGKGPAGFTGRPNREGPVITISASGASAGFIALHRGPIWASDCSTIEASNSYDLDFIYLSLLLRQQDIYLRQAGGAQPHVHAKDIYPMEVLLPSDKEEQRAIAEVFNDVDSEIDVLIRKHEWALAIKKGMMQEIFTGRTRLKLSGV